MIAFKAYLQQWRSYSRAFGANAPAKNYKFGLLNIIFYKIFP